MHKDRLRWSEYFEVSLLMIYKNSVNNSFISVEGGFKVRNLLFGYVSVNILCPDHHCVQAYPTLKTPWLHLNWLHLRQAVRLSVTTAGHVPDAHGEWVGVASWRHHEWSPVCLLLVILCCHYYRVVPILFLRNVPGHNYIARSWTGSSTSSSPQAPPNITRHCKYCNIHPPWSELLCVVETHLYSGLKWASGISCGVVLDDANFHNMLSILYQCDWVSWA